MRCEEYGIGAFRFGNAGVQASKQQKDQGKYENQRLQTGQLSEGFLCVRGDQWMTAHVAVSPTLVGVSKCSTKHAQSGVTIPCGVQPPRCNWIEICEFNQVPDNLGKAGCYCSIHTASGSGGVRDGCGYSEYSRGKQQGMAGIKQVSAGNGFGWHAATMGSQSSVTYGVIMGSAKSGHAMQ